FLFSESDGPAAERKPNEYRKTFIALANDRSSPDETFLESPAGRAAVLSTVPEHLRSRAPKELSPDERRALERARRALRSRRAANHLEVYGIPPTLSVLERRMEEDAAKTCYASVNLDALRRLDFEITFQNRDQAHRDYAEAMEDAGRVTEKAAGTARPVADTSPPLEPVARLERYRRGQLRLAAVRATQARLECEGLLPPGSRHRPGAFDLATHTALAEFEKKNDIFGWGFIAGETHAALLRPSPALHFETFRRILAERLSDAAGILEDGSVSKGGSPATWVDASGVVRPVPNLIGDFVDALLRGLRIETPEDLARFLREVGPGGFASLRVAFAAPPLPEYYGRVMDLSVEIDRGDVWYDPPFDEIGSPVVQRRDRYPSFTLFVRWREQKIPLVRWRTTIGSWRSELHDDARLYLKYKNSDVGPRIWKSIVAAPVWVPPAATPGRDLVVRKVFDPRQGPVTVVNTEVMGPGFASAYGLGMAIHLKKLPDGGLFDNLIRTHGSVDYTSIARRFSHGCHRLVNNRAVRLFGFVLKHRSFDRMGSRSLRGFRRKLHHEGA
ncbi:MAG: L,D-transpeptidase, partial [Candidatus Binatia bacterium]